MAQVDPWEKAADCERAIRITLDPLHRETLTNIREFWIALAHKSRFLSADALATQIETIGRLHAKLDRDARPENSLVGLTPECAQDISLLLRARRERRRGRRAAEQRDELAAFQLTLHPVRSFIGLDR